MLAKYRFTAISTCLIFIACGGTTVTSTQQDSSPSIDVDSEASDFISDDAFEEMLFQAGSSDSDGIRHEILQQLEQKTSPEHPSYDDLVSLIETSDLWTHSLERMWAPGDQEQAGEGGYLGGYFVLKVFPDNLGEIYPPTLSESSPLEALWCLYRGRMLIWAAIENGFLTDSYFADARACLEKTAGKYPDNELLRVYLGPAKVTAKSAQDESAPQWANDFRRALEQLNDVLHFWITQRQAQDGQFGGGWGDDVEIWRNFAPILLAFNDSLANEAFERLANNIFELPRLAGGYTTLMTDVEHSAEDTGDSITMMLHLKPESPVWQSRAQQLYDLMTSLWTSENEKGHLQFKSTYFTSDEVDSSPEHACDTTYHTRAIQPALLLWQRSESPETMPAFEEWLSTWVDAAASSERGKPEGVVPSSIHYPSGLVGGPGSDWWNPVCHYTDKTFQWPRALSSMLVTLVQAYDRTGNTSYLAPIQSMTQIRRKFHSGELTDETKGSEGWCAKKMAGSLRDALAKLYLVNGAEEYLDVLLKDAGAYLHYRLTQDLTPLTNALANIERALRSNTESYTSEVRFTDRLFKFNTRYTNEYVEEPIPSVNSSLLYEMATGDMGNPLYFPLPAVQWETPPKNIAVLVEKADEQNFEAQLYHFGNEERPLSLRLLRIQSQQIPWVLECGDIVASEGITKTKDSLAIKIPAKQLCRLQAGEL